MKTTALTAAIVITFITTIVSNIDTHAKIKQQTVDQHRVNTSALQAMQRQEKRIESLESSVTSLTTLFLRVEESARVQGLRIDSAETAIRRTNEMIIPHLNP